MSEPRKPRPPDEPVPRDPADQQATAEDPLSVPLPEGAGEASPPDTGEASPPDTDEAGTGPRGRVREGTVHPEHPAPEEPPG
ncbi:hypothetical protein [Streptomyces sp. NPDC008122]|uniref:hypothetical protein n=1 Tax=Streptomyces sp. NPDC008122 TaxID=3364810 RepID=UPI0036E3C88C